MSKLKSNYIFNLLLTGFNIIFPIVSFPYAAKILGPGGIGKVQFILSFTQYFALIAALGIPIYGSRAISQASHDAKLLYSTLSELLYIHVVCSVLITLFYIITILSFSFFSNDKDLYLLSGLIILMSFTSIDWYFYGVENFKLIAIRSVIIKLISLILLYAFVKSKQDYNTYLFISIFSILGNNIINIISVIRHVQFRPTGIKKHLKPLIYTFGTTIATSMYTMLDTILLGVLSDSRAVGLYSASIKLIKISIPIVLSSATVLMPRISKLFSSKDFEELKPLLNKSFSYIIFLAIPACVGFFLLASEFINIFSGDQFFDGILTMRILSPLTLIIGLGYFWGYQILIPAGRDKEMLIAVIVGMIANLILNFVITPTYHQNGAAVANILSELLVTFMYMYFCLKILPFTISYRPILLSIVATIPFLLIVVLVKKLNLGVFNTLIIDVLLCAISYITVQTLILNKQMTRELIGSFRKK